MSVVQNVRYLPSRIITNYCLNFCNSGRQGPNDLVLSYLYSLGTGAKLEGNSCAYLLNSLPKKKNIKNLH